RELLDRIGQADEVWLGLIGAALDLPEPRTIDGLVERLRSTEPHDLRMELIEWCTHCRSDVDSKLIERAADGDPKAIDEIAASGHCGMPKGTRALLESTGESISGLIADTIAAFDAEIFRGGAGIGDVLERDARHKRDLGRTLDPPRLVEMATNGITFQMQAEVDGVVLIPSVIIRPWVTITEHGRHRVFCYPVAEENLTADPDTPPMRLVEVYKALGDERRLRMLHILSVGPASLAEITSRVDLAKSTVHHHLTVLRRAGLVRVTVGAEKEYSLRSDAVPDAADLLSTFLANTA
ncbi:MAG: metalloregulator ArsR/SmtB family transcription factor, partial [Acidimicrobiia bacterium]